MQEKKQAKMQKAKKHSYVYEKVNHITAKHIIITVNP